MAILDYLKDYGERAARDASSAGEYYRQRTQEQIKPAVSAARLEPSATVFPGAFRPTPAGRATIMAQDNPLLRYRPAHTAGTLVMQNTPTRTDTTNSIVARTPLAPPPQAAIDELIRNRPERSIGLRDVGYMQVEGGPKRSFQVDTAGQLYERGKPMPGYGPSPSTGTGAIPQFESTVDRELEQNRNYFSGGTALDSERALLRTALGAVPSGYENLSPRRKSELLVNANNIINQRRTLEQEQYRTVAGLPSALAETEQTKALAEQARGAGALSKAQADVAKFTISPEGRQQALDVERAKQRDETFKREMDLRKTLNDSQNAYIKNMLNDTATVDAIRTQLAQRSGVNPEDISGLQIMQEARLLARQYALNDLGGI